MTQVATPDTARASFDGTTVNLPGTTIHLQQRGSALWATFPDPDAAATTNRAPETIDRQIVMITGSHQQQAFWASRTDRGFLPARTTASDSSSSPEGRWIPRQSAFLYPHADSSASETGRWNGVCINCHATHGKWRFASPIPSRLSDASAADTTTAELGIACEACHGPAGDHVRANGNPVRRYRRHLEGGADPTVINPIRLDPIRSSQVCGQCHSVWNYYDRQSEQDTNTTGAPYRPAENLAEKWFIAAPPHNTGSPGAAGRSTDPGARSESAHRLALGATV